MRHVVLVEGDRALRNVLLEALAGAGYRVTPRASGPEALDAARRDRPEAIVLDFDAPLLDAREFPDAWAAAGRDAQSPIVALSAGPELLAGLARLEVRAHLVKPFGLDALLEAVGRVTGPPASGANIEMSPGSLMTRGWNPARSQTARPTTC